MLTDLSEAEAIGLPRDGVEKQSALSRVHMFLEIVSFSLANDVIIMV